MDRKVSSFTFKVPDSSPGQRIDQFLAETLLQTPGLPRISREKIKGLIKRGKVLLDGRGGLRPGVKVGPGQCVELEIGPVEAGGRLEPEAKELNILYQDEDLLVLDKPAGLTVHPAPGRMENTLVHRLLHHFPQLKGLDRLRPGIVHRIDKDTSGLLLVALNEESRLGLAEQFAGRLVKKEYLALARGVPKTPADVLDWPIGRHPTQKVKMAVANKGGKPALTSYKTIYADPEERFSLLSVSIHTGRTHQIRVHLSRLGHPLLGDRVYGPSPDKEDRVLGKLASRQLLHARRIAFTHPAEGKEMAFVSPPPPDFIRVMLYLSQRTQRVVLTGMPGCGKSTIAGELERAGLPLFSADRVVAELYQPGQDGWSFLRSRFGERFVPEEDSPVDKGALFRAMVESAEVRRETVQAVHPMVMHRLGIFWEEQARKRAAVAEIPLYFEAASDDKQAGGQKGRNMAVGIYCPKQERLKRLEKRGWDQDTLAALESWQWPEHKKLQACGLVLDNSGPVELAGEAGERLLRVLAMLRRGRMKRLHRLFSKLLRSLEK